MAFSWPGESPAAHTRPSLQAPPGTRGLRIRPRRSCGARRELYCHQRRQQSPAFGRAAPRPAHIGRPRPSKACIPLHSSALCLSVHLRRPGATRPPATPAAAFVLPGRTQHRSPSGEGEARLPAVPRGEWTASRRASAAPADFCPASSPNKSGLRPANARFRSYSSAITFLPLITNSSRLAVLAGLQRLPPSRQTLQPNQADPRPTAAVRHDIDRPALRLAAGSENKTPHGAAAAPPPLRGLFIQG